MNENWRNPQKKESVAKRGTGLFPKLSLFLKHLPQASSACLYGGTENMETMDAMEAVEAMDAMEYLEASSLSIFPKPHP